MELVFSAQEIAQAMGITRGGVTMRVTRQAWAHKKRVNANSRTETVYPYDTLPKDVQHHLRKAYPDLFLPASRVQEKRDLLAAARREFEAASDAKRARATRNADALKARDGLVKGGMSIDDASKLVAAQYGVNRSTIYEWARKVDAIAPKDYAAMLLPRQAGGVKLAGRCAIHDATWLFFRTAYLRPARIDFATCYRQTVIEAHNKGWPMPPSLFAFRRKLERDVSQMEQVLAREGVDAVRARWPSQMRDRSHFAAMEALNADGHKLDVFVRTPCRTRIVRPMLIGWQCLYSAKIVGWRLSETESSDAIRLSYMDTTAYGVGKLVWFDNGRGFAAKAMTAGSVNRFRFRVKQEDVEGIFSQLGVEVHFTQPFNGRAKPIERAWRDLASSISKHPICEGAYTGPNPDAKPENYGTKALEWDAMQALCKAQIDEHNARVGRKGGTANGRSFDQVFAESYAKTTPLYLSDSQKRQLLLQSQPVTVSRTEMSVMLHRNKYWSTELLAWMGKRIVLRVDPDNLQQGAYAYTETGKFIAPLECMAPVGFNDVAAAKQYARAKRMWVRAAKDALKAQNLMSLAELQRQMTPEPGEVQAVEKQTRKVVAGEFKRLKPEPVTKEGQAVLDRYNSQLFNIMEERARRAGMRD